MTHRDKFGRPVFGRKWGRPQEGVRQPRKLPISSPLEVKPSEEGYFAVFDASGRMVASVDFEEDETLRAKDKLYSEGEARDIANVIARLLAEVAGAAPERLGPIIPLDELNAENDE